MVDMAFFKKSSPLCLKDIAEICEGILRLNDATNADFIIDELSSIQDAGEGEVCFLQNAKYAQYLESCKASLVLIDEKRAAKAPTHLNLLICADPYRSWAALTQAYYPFDKREAFIHETAVIAPTAQIDETAFIGPHVVIEDNVIIGKNTEIHAGSYIGHSVKIGDSSIIYSNCSITHAHIGHLTVIHTGVRIGQDGFGFAMGPKGHKYVRQLGRVLIGNDVNIGANTTIDRGAGPDTVIGDGVRIDNLVQIGHNAQIGQGSVLAGQAGVAGSATIGRGVVIGGQSGITGHLTVGDGAVITGGSGVDKDVKAGEVLASGIPAVPLKQHWQRIAMLNRLNQFYKELKK